MKSQSLGENHGILGKIFGTEPVKRTSSELSPRKDAPSKKRSAFGDITNVSLCFCKSKIFKTLPVLLNYYS